MARTLGAKVIFEAKQRYGNAHRAGVAIASGDILATADGDATYPTQHIPEIVDHLVENGLDFVSACRFPLRNSRAMRTRNVLGNKLLTTIMNALYCCSLEDSQSGMWVFKRHCLQKMKLTSGGMSFSEEIKIEAILHPDIAVGEYHIPYFERVGDTKLIPWRDGLHNLLFLLRRRLRS